MAPEHGDSIGARESPFKVMLFLALDPKVEENQGQKKWQNRDNCINCSFLYTCKQNN
ncbi:hypothetical protein BVRB_6g133160 [Beta vulgaris subsp. vulgaris]|nr:hypothetical protein BVRB_6g133160 [Beta vulgaris subsp. vulgaris]